MVKRLVAAVQEATSNDETRAKLSALGAESSYLDTSAFKAFLQNDLTRAQRAVKLGVDTR